VIAVAAVVARQEIIHTLQNYIFGNREALILWCIKC